jgi:hypothetical protein
MKKIEKKIISIGGGGFTHRSDKILDKFVIDQKIKEILNSASYQQQVKITTIKLNHFIKN